VLCDIKRDIRRVEHKNNKEDKLLLSFSFASHHKENKFNKKDLTYFILLI